MPLWTSTGWRQECARLVQPSSDQRDFIRDRHLVRHHVRPSPHRLAVLTLLYHGVGILVGHPRGFARDAATGRRRPCAIAAMALSEAHFDRLSPRCGSATAAVSAPPILLRPACLSAPGHRPGVVRKRGRCGLGGFARRIINCAGPIVAANEDVRGTQGGVRHTRLVFRGHVHACALSHRLGRLRPLIPIKGPNSRRAYEQRHSRGSHGLQNNPGALQRQAASSSAA